MKKLSTRYFAHRGYHEDHQHTPENSMAAFRLAVERGYGIEMDVQLTADRQVVLFHDNTLDRVCQVPGKVSSYTYEQLQQFYLYDSQERIPLLTEVLDMVGGRVPLLIEIKMDLLDIAVCEETARILDSYEGEFVVESFNPYALYWFMRNRPLISRGQLGSNFLASDLTVPIWQRLLLHPMLTNLITRPDFISYCHSFRRCLPYRFWKRKLVRFGWTFRSEEEMLAAKQDFDYFIFEKEYSS